MKSKLDTSMPNGKVGKSKMEVREQDESREM
jgi:hypothetical protein